MATYTNTRRRLITGNVNPFANAEGNVVLNFRDYLLVAADNDFDVSKRNKLPISKFYFVNQRNGDTIAVMAQLQLRDELNAAMKFVEDGKKVVVRHVAGVRGSREFQTGTTTIFARDLTLDLPKVEEAEKLGPVPVSSFIPPAVFAESEVVAQSIQ